MKYIAISTAIAFSAAVAHADPVTVKAPKTPITAESATAYVAELDRAVKRVCQEAASPVIGTNYYVYQSCLKATRLEVGEKDPTGLYASRSAPADAVLAAK